MGNIRIDPKKQFSKRLARWTAIFWFFYMTWLSVILLIQPAAALYSMYMGIIVTSVMILNVAAYTRNSIVEKLAFAMIDKTKIEVSLKAGGTKKGGTDETEYDIGYDIGYDADEGGESNG